MYRKPLEYLIASMKRFGIGHETERVIDHLCQEMGVSDRKSLERKLKLYRLYFKIESSGVVEILIGHLGRLRVKEPLKITTSLDAITLAKGIGSRFYFGDNVLYKNPKEDEFTQRRNANPKEIQAIIVEPAYGKTTDEFKYLIGWGDEREFVVESELHATVRRKIGDKEKS